MKHLNLSLIVLLTIFNIAVSGVSGQIKTDDLTFPDAVDETEKVFNLEQLEKARYFMEKSEKGTTVSLPDLKCDGSIPLIQYREFKKPSFEYYETHAVICHKLGDFISRDESLIRLRAAFSRTKNQYKSDKFSQMIRVLKFFLQLNNIGEANQLVTSFNEGINEYEKLKELVEILHNSPEMSNSLNETIEHMNQVTRRSNRSDLARMLYEWKMTESAILVMDKTLKSISDKDVFASFCSLALKYIDIGTFNSGLSAWESNCRSYSDYENLLSYMIRNTVAVEKQKEVIRKMYPLCRSFEGFDFLIKKCLTNNWNDLAIEIQEAMIAAHKNHKLSNAVYSIPVPEFLYTLNQMPSTESVDIYTYSGALNEKLGETDYADEYYRQALFMDMSAFLKYGGFRNFGNLNRFFYFYKFAATQSDDQSLDIMRKLDPWVTSLEQPILSNLEKSKISKQSELTAITGQAAQTDKSKKSPPKIKQPPLFYKGHLIRLFQALVVCILSWLIFILCDFPEKNNSSQAGVK